jgi:hypothetical protein
MAELVVQEPGEGGQPEFRAASEGGDTFENRGDVYLEATGPLAEWKIVVHNGRECSFHDHPPFEIVSPAGEDYVRSERFSTFRFNDPGAGGRVRVTYEPSAVGIQIAAIRMGTIFKGNGGAS